MTDAERYQKNTNQEIWILSLYKQHFLDQYAPDMENQYSCWGYYDGLSLIPISVESEEKSEDGDRQIPSSSYHTSRLFEKKSLASISRIWCGSMYSSMSLDGGYSKQNVGIFRCADTDDENEFGKKKKELVEKSPFFAVAFVQLKDKSRYGLISMGPLRTGPV